MVKTINRQVVTRGSLTRIGLYAASWSRHIDKYSKWASTKRIYWNH